MILANFPRFFGLSILVGALLGCSEESGSSADDDASDDDKVADDSAADDADDDSSDDDADDDGVPEPGVLTLNGQPAPLDPTVLVVARGVPNINVTSFQIMAGQGPATATNATVTLEIGGNAGAIDLGFTQDDVSATIAIDVYHPTHQLVVNYTSGRIGLKAFELIVESTGGRVKGKATQTGRPWAGANVVDGMDDEVVFTFDVPHPLPPQR